MKAASKRWVLAIGVALASLLLPATELAARDQVMILPFLIRGNASAAGITDERGMSEGLQEASAFLLPIMRSTRVVSPADTRLALERAGYSPQAMQPEMLSSLCRSYDRALYVLQGSVSFIDRQSNEVEVRAYSCPARTRVGEAQAEGDVYSMQSLLRKTLFDSTAFINPVPSYVRPTVNTATVDLAVVLDTSGSMTSDVPSILNALNALGSRLPNGSRLGVITLNSGDSTSTYQFSQDWAGTLGQLRSVSISGRITSRAIEDGLSVVNRFREWRGSRWMFLFTNTGSDRRMTRVESHLRRMKSSGIKVSLFDLQNQGFESRQEWRRISRVLGLADPGVVYGRVASFVDGDRLLFVRDGARFYRTADVSLATQLQRDRLDEDRLLPIETIRYEPEALTLHRFPERYAQLSNRRLDSVGPIVSNLEERILASAERSSSLGTVSARVQLRNEGNSFWIDVGSERVAAQLRSLRGRTVYLGATFVPARASDRRVANLPSPIYIETNSAPRLMLTTYERLSRWPLELLRAEDTWFMQVTILEVGDGQRDF